MRAEIQARFSIWLDRLTHSRRSWEGFESQGPVGSRVLAFSPPGYLGVTESTRRFFVDWCGLPERDLLLASDRAAFVAALVAAEPEAVVFSGFAEGYGKVLEAFREHQPAIPTYVLWHASPLQLAQPEERRHYDSILALARAGVITRVGFFKTGEGAAVSRLGIDATDLFNLPPAGPPRPAFDPLEGAADRADAPLRLGIFSAGPSWRKNPYAMVAAAARLGSVRLSGVLDRETQRYARDLGIELGEVRETAFDRPALEELAARQDANLYVGLSECSPLFPLESLHWGVPCLVGANSHLFESSPVRLGEGVATGSAEASRERVTDAAELLESRLVVPRTDDPSSIARAIGAALADAKAIGSAYRDWVPAYRAACWAAMESFLERPLRRMSDRDEPE